VADVAVRTVPVTRGKLASFLPNHELVKAFEALTSDVGQTLPDAIITAQQDAAAAQAAAQAALDAVAALTVGAWNSTTINFGAVPIDEGTFTVTDTSVDTDSIIVATVMGSDSTVDNDAEAHQLAAAFFRFSAEPSGGSFTLRVLSLFGLCSGLFKVRYQVT